MSAENTDVAVTCLLAAVADAQGTIRSYDIKAEILAAIVTVAVGLVQWLVPATSGPVVSWLALVSTVPAALALVFVGLVVAPRKKARAEINLGSYVPTHAFFPHTSVDRSVNVSTFAGRALDTDWVAELTFELHKLVRIREDKANWFRRALLALGTCLGLVLLLAATKIF